jgi:hypothetical protein
MNHCSIQLYLGSRLQQRLSFWFTLDNQEGVAVILNVGGEEVSCPQGGFDAILRPCLDVAGFISIHMC